MTKNIKKPAVRFKGFTDAWEQRELGELYQPNTERNENQFGSDKTISIATMTFKTEGNGAAKESIPNYKVLRVGDIAFEGHTNKEFRYGRFVLNDVGNGIMSPRFTTLRPIREIPISFWKQYIHYEPLMRMLLVNATKAGTMMNELVVPEALAQSIPVPSIAEQQRIGIYFRNLDTLITLHQRKCDTFQKLKKSMLQKMFPQNDKSVPEFRFEGFTDAWEQRKLSDVANRYDNLRVPITASKRVTGTTPYYGANGIQDYVEGYTHEGEFILVAEDGANDTINYPVQYVNGRIWVNNHAHVLQAIQKQADTRLLGYAISQADIASILVGGGRAKLNADIMMKMELQLPKNLSEQHQIGLYFKNLDNLITLHQRKLETLKKLKKSMLQKMFV